MFCYSARTSKTDFTARFLYARVDSECCLEMLISQYKQPSHRRSRIKQIESYVHLITKYPFTNKTWSNHLHDLLQTCHNVSGISSPSLSHRAGVFAVQRMLYSMNEQIGKQINHIL